MLSVKLRSSKYKYRYITNINNTKVRALYYACSACCDWKQMPVLRLRLAKVLTSGYSNKSESSVRLHCRCWRFWGCCCSAFFFTYQTPPLTWHRPPIHHFTNQDRSMVMLIRLSLWSFSFVLHATSWPTTVTALSPPPLHHPRSSPPLLHCTQTQHDASCNHCWTQFQGQFEDYLLSLVNKKQRASISGCSFEAHWQAYRWIIDIVITEHVQSFSVFTF